MPSRGQYSILVILSAAIGAIVSITRRFTVLLMELPMANPDIQLLSWYTLGIRGVAFLLVYGLLFGVAYQIAGEPSHPDGSLKGPPLAGVAGAGGFAIATLGLVIATDIDFQGWLFTGLATIGPGFAVGVQFSVVVFAGMALSRRQHTSSEPTAHT